VDYIDVADAVDPEFFGAVPDAPYDLLMPAVGMDAAVDAEVDSVMAMVLESVWSTSLAIPVLGDIVFAGLLLASTFLLIWDAVQRNKE
jgi:hypothetical protein